MKRKITGNRQIFGFTTMSAIMLILIFISGCAKDNTIIDNETDIVSETNEKNNEDVGEDKNNSQVDDSMNDGQEEVEQLTNNSSDNEDNVNNDSNTYENKKTVNYEEVKPYETGEIIIVMYHGIMDNPPYHRTAENFKKDLQYMYDHGYRLISMKDFINNDISVEAGYTPIVLTFDDGLPSTFSLEEVNGELVPKADTAIGIIETFANEHPDFGRTATLYINGNSKTTFGDVGTYEEKLNWLVDHGYQLGNHLSSHPRMDKLNEESIQKEIAIVNKLITDAVPGYVVDAVSYPFGIRPDEAYMQYVEKGSYEGHTYINTNAVREALRKSMVPSVHIDFDPMNCSRVRGNEGEYGEVWWAFENYERRPEKRYISDGDKNTVVVPKEKEEEVDVNRLADKELITY